MTSPLTDERILVAAPPGRDGSLTCEVLTRVGMRCTLCADLGALRERVGEAAGAAVLLEEVLGNGAMQPLLDVLAHQPSWSALPLVVITHGGRGTQRSGRMLEALGSQPKVTFLERPVRILTLVSTLRTALASRRRQYEVRDLLRALEDAVRRRDEFLAMLGHELRNPLAAIRNAIELLRHVGSEDRLFTTARRILERQAIDLARLLDDLLDVARVTQGRIQLRPERIDVVALLHDAVETARRGGGGAERRIDMTTSPGAVWLEADPTRLRQVLANLLNNAIKYTAPGDHVRVILEPKDEMLRITVADDGSGMNAETLEHVFDPFVQADRTLDRSQGGLGVGLTVARRVVEMHGGTITAASEGLGRGSTFVVHLPLTPLGPSDVAAPGAPGETGGSPRPIRVLVVEDNADSADSLAMLLEARGHVVRIAYDGERALAQARAFRPDVALLDLGLPRIDGYEVARRLRRDPALGGLSLIALTGYGQDADRKRSAAAGFDHHLVKPVDLERLDTLVAAATRAG